MEGDFNLCCHLIPKDNIYHKCAGLGKLDAQCPLKVNMHLIFRVHTFCYVKMKKTYLQVFLWISKTIWMKAVLQMPWGYLLCKEVRKCLKTNFCLPMEYETFKSISHPCMRTCQRLIQEPFKHWRASLLQKWLLIY